MLFLSFLLVELVRMVKVCAISFKICMRLGLARKKNNICLVIARKSFLLNCGFYGKRGNSDLALVYLRMLVLVTTISVPNFMLVSKSAQFTENF